ncbi:MAG: Fic family protein [Acinetobacter sp.]|nr:Fic family protein [Acinetobacter sp.]
MQTDLTKCPIYYNPDKLHYQPIFSPQELSYLEALNHHSNSEYLMQPQRNIEAFSMEFAYTSALLEGNAYTPSEALVLLQMGLTAKSEKKLGDALTIKNLHESFQYLTNAAVNEKNNNPTTFINVLKHAHHIASTLLLDQTKHGTVRQNTIFLKSNRYIPSSIPEQLERGLETIIETYHHIQNPFEQAVYIHQNLSYLLYFSKHNKRTARNMCAYTLMLAKKMPILFTEKNSPRYAQAVKHYCESETADYSLFKLYFIHAYEFACSRMNAHAVTQAQAMCKFYE